MWRLGRRSRTALKPSRQTQWGNELFTLGSPIATRNKNVTIANVEHTYSIAYDQLVYTMNSQTNAANADIRCYDGVGGALPRDTAIAQAAMQQTVAEGAADQQLAVADAAAAATLSNAQNAAQINFDVASAAANRDAVAAWAGAIGTPWAQYQLGVAEQEFTGVSSESAALLKMST